MSQDPPRLSPHKPLPILEVSSTGTVIEPLKRAVALNEEMKSQTNNTTPQPWSNLQSIPWPTKLRPLSDIRELTEPSLIENAGVMRHEGLARSSSLQRGSSVNRTGALKQQHINITRKVSQQSNIEDRSTVSNYSSRIERTFC